MATIKDSDLGWFASENGLAEFTLDRIGGLVDQVNMIHKLDQVSRDESRWQRLVDARLYDEALNQPDLIDAACKWINSLSTVYDSCSAEGLESIMRSGPANSLTCLASSVEAVVAGHDSVGSDRCEA